jgi:uncharacterized membrane protein (UPF0127 family)
VASFLSPLLRSPEAAFVLQNSRTGTAVATRIETAFESASRRKGLLGRRAFDEGSALIIAPCSSVHTLFMQMAIDVVFASRDGRVLKVYSRLPPWRIAYAMSAFAAIELPSGAVERSPLGRGDVLLLRSDESQV